MAWIFPSSYEDCLLFCLDAGTLLHKESNQQSIFIQMNFTSRASQEELVFLCEWMDARDGGIPFLSVYDLVRRKGLAMGSMPYAMRHQMLSALLDSDEYFSRAATSNEFRVSIPQLHPISETAYLTDWMFNTYHGLIRGFRLTDDSPKNLFFFEDTDFLVTGSDVPDQYFLRKPDGSAVFGHDMLYVNSLDMSRRLTSTVNPRGTVMRCSWVPTRQKWTLAS